MVKSRREIRKIIARYVTSLEMLGIEVSRIILYGSYAKGRAKEYSDIDIAVVSPAFEKMNIFERQEILSKAHHNFGEPIEPIGLTPDQLNERHGFAKEVIDHGFVIYTKEDKAA